MTEKTKADLLVDKFNDEMSKYQMELCQKGAEYVYEHAYEIVIKNELIYAPYELSDDQIDFIIQKGYTLHDFYEAWMDNDGCELCSETTACVEDFIEGEMLDAEGEED